MYCHILYNIYKDFIIASIKPHRCSFESLSNEEIMDYSLLLKYYQGYLESFYKNYSTTIFYNETGRDTISTDHFHIHMIIRSSDDKLSGDIIYPKLKEFQIEDVSNFNKYKSIFNKKEEEEDKEQSLNNNNNDNSNNYVQDIIEKTENEVQSIQNFIHSKTLETQGLV